MKRSTSSLRFLVLLQLTGWIVAAQVLAGTEYDLLVYSHHTPQIKRYNGETGQYINGFEKPDPVWDYLGMALGKDGFLYVTTASADKLYRYDISTGKVVDIVHVGEPFNHPLRITFGPDGLLYASNRDGHSVARYDVINNEPSGIFVPTGSGGLNNPRGLTFGPDGNLYVASRTNSAILRYDGTSGEFIDEFVPSGLGGLAWPRAIQFGPNGNLFVCGYDSNNVLEYDAVSGECLGEFVPPGRGGLQHPAWMEFGPDGNLYVCNPDKHQVLRFDGQTGEFIDVFVTSRSGGLNVPASLIFVPATRPHLPPTKPAVVLNPENPMTHDDILCEATGSVADGTFEVSYKFAWFINDELVASATSEILPSSFTKRDDVVTCVVTPTDGVADGPTAAASVVIVNSPPPVPIIKILPETPTPSDNLGLAVLIVQQDPDPDGDTIFYVFEWFQSEDGVDWTRRPELSGSLPPPVYIRGQPEISSLYTQIGMYWRVDVTAWDGFLESESKSGQTLKSLGSKAEAVVYVKPDLTGDMTVNEADLLVVLENWKRSKGELPPDVSSMFFGVTAPDDSQIGVRHLFEVALKNWKR